MLKRIVLLKQIALATCLLLVPVNAQAEITQSAADGFQIVVKQTTSLNPGAAYRVMIEDFANWYDASHSYSGVAENLSLDIAQHCMLERLPGGGFVRHMEIVYQQPGQVFRMTGGLGPLQEMGINGALTFSFNEVEGGTEITLTYNVTGSSFQQLDKIAVPVDGVLEAQLERLKNYCDEKG
ncbi:MAG: hypothetical protein ACR2NP_07695 [Pirellulaceae bacterium]